MLLNAGRAGQPTAKGLCVRTIIASHRRMAQTVGPLDLYLCMPLYPYLLSVSDASVSASVSLRYDGGYSAMANGCR